MEHPVSLTAKSKGKLCVAGSSPALRTMRLLWYRERRLMVISNGRKISVVTVQIGTTGKELPAVRASRPYYDSIGDLRQW